CGKELPGALRNTLDAITASHPDERAALLASQIAREHPDLLAIQEAVFAEADDRPRVWMLGTLVMELNKLGKPYEIVDEMTGLDTGSVHVGDGTSIRFSISDAILVRSDLPFQDRAVIDHQEGLYSLSLNVDSQRAYEPNDVAQPCLNGYPEPHANM